jgi:uncharacterized protein (DUF1501 family)
MTTPIAPDREASEAALALSCPPLEDRAALTRRSFLLAAAAGVGASMMPSWMDRIAAAAAPLGPAQGILVHLTLDGGNDDLDTFVRYTSGAYYDARGSLAIPATRVRKITSSRGLHPDLPYLQHRFLDGDVAIIDGVGNPKVDLSHFSAMADHHHGRPVSGVPTTGWLGRWLDGLPGEPLAGVSIGARLPLLTRGSVHSATAIPEHPDHFLGTGGAGLGVALEQMATGSTGRGPFADLLADTAGGMLTAASDLAPAYEPTAGGRLAQQMVLAARLINADVGVRVLTVKHGGYDSHAGQAPMHAARMAELDEALAAFHATLDDAFATRTLVLCTSEFGRRVRKNGSAGTDHGAGGAMFAIGEPVRGGFYGQPASLTKLTAQGNQRHSVGYRQVYATVVQDWLRADPYEILGSNALSLGFTARPGHTPTEGVYPAPRFRGIHADVLRLYRAFFNREPDPRGGEYWVGVINKGRSLDQVADYFTKTTEFIDTYRGTTNLQFVEKVYRNVLGRTPDAEGVLYWKRQLDSGKLTRGGVVRWIAASSEFKAKRPYAGIPA